jgi:hypothetical protein
MAIQDNWLFCTKCYSVFWYGDPVLSGLCPATAEHSPFEDLSPTHAGTSWNFALEIASTNPPPQSSGGGAGNSPAGTQGNWRICTKCYSLFWYGYATAGVCPATAEHSPFAGVPGSRHAGTSWDFAPQIASTDRPAPSPGGGPGLSPAGTQGNWRFCTKCYTLFWYGNPTAGVCSAKGAHSPFAEASPTHAGTSWNFALIIASTDPPPRKPPPF